MCYINFYANYSNRVGYSVKCEACCSSPCEKYFNRVVVFVLFYDL